MAYRKTRRSREQIARMQEGKARARMERPTPERAPELPELRRRIVITDYDFGERVHTIDLYRTNRVDCGIIAEAKDECESSLLPNQSASVSFNPQINAALPTVFTRTGAGFQVVG